MFLLADDMTIAIAVCPTCGARTDDYLSRHFPASAVLPPF
jgi:hypothetical protein